MRQMLEGRVLSWFHCAFGHWHVPACWWQPEYYSPPGCSVPGKGENSFSCISCEDFSMTSIKFLRDPATGLPTDAFDAGSTTASSFAGERVGIVLFQLPSQSLDGDMKCMQQEEGALFVGSQPPEWGCPILGRANLSKQRGPGEVKNSVPGEKHWSNYLWYTNSCTTWVDKNMAICGVFYIVLLCHQIVQDFVHRPDPPLQALLEDMDEDDEEFEEACSA